MEIFQKFPNKYLGIIVNANNNHDFDVP